MVMIFMMLGMKSGSIGNLMKLLHRAHLVSDRQYHQMVNYYNYTWHAVNCLKEHNDMYTVIVLNFHMLAMLQHVQSASTKF